MELPKRQNPWLPELLDRIQEAVNQRGPTNSLLKSIGVDLRKEIATLNPEDYNTLEQEILLSYPTLTVHMRVVHLLIEKSHGAIQNPQIVRIRIWCSGYTHRQTRIFTPSNMLIALQSYAICCDSLRYGTRSKKH